MVKKRAFRWFVIPLVSGLALFGLEGLISLIFGQISPLIKAIVGLGGAYLILQLVERVFKIEIF